MVSGGGASNRSSDTRNDTHLLFKTRAPSSKQVHVLCKVDRHLSALDWSNLQTLVDISNSKLKRERTLCPKFMFYMTCTF